MGDEVDVLGRSLRPCRRVYDVCSTSTPRTAILFADLSIPLIGEPTGSALLYGLIVESWEVARCEIKWRELAGCGNYIGACEFVKQTRRVVLE